MRGADFAGTERFEVLARLGAGGMGVVYEAFDRQTSSRVALKTLRAKNAETLLRFKEEFRGIQHLEHPNLVSLGELIETGGQWFFTMELVDGVSFVQYVRAGDFPGDRPSAEAAGQQFDEVRLRQTLPQLAYALQALHRANKVHRDIKPSNVLVTREGRLVLLDFGFIADTDGEGHTTDGIVVGTADYMAPEQAAGDPVTPAADWYAVGVVLYRALTGRLPYSGSRLEVLMRKQQAAPRRPRALEPSVPEDLDALCMELLAIPLDERADGGRIIAVLGVTPGAEASRKTTAEPTDDQPFVGRGRELAQLFDAFAQVQRGRSVTVYLTGESGVGKTALIQRFMGSVRKQESRSVVLVGRCHERESVPYKAVDGVIDALSRWMRGASPADASAMLPLDAALLAQIFPVLRRVEAVAQAPPPLQESQDPLEQRRRVFGAMRELLARVADRRPLVVVVEDLQWIDADSLALLKEVMQPPEEPPLLLVATARTEAGQSALTALAGVPGFSVAGAAADVRQVHLGGLPADEARALAALLLRRAGGDVAVGAQSIADETGGHPLFIDELVQHTVELGGAGQALPNLEGALWSRIGRLGPEARRVLEVIAVAGAPLRQETAAAAAELDFGAFAQRVARLRAARLTRTTGTGRGDEIEPYHGRVRDAVIAHLALGDAGACHRRLALALEAGGADDPEALAVHWHGGGDRERAGHYAEVAAARAAEALAFDRAARLYRQSLEWRPVDGAFGRRLKARLGDALAHGGRGAEAAEAYLDAATGSSVAARLELGRMAADQLLRTGHIDRGLEVLREVLRAAGMKLPDAHDTSLWRVGWARLKIARRGLRFRERDATQVSLEDLTRVDLLWSVSSGLVNVDPVRGLDFEMRHLLLALDAGEPHRVCRALATDLMYAAAGGVERRTGKLRRVARELAARIGDDHARGLVALASGAGDVYAGQWEAGLAACDEADAILRERCTNVWWERVTAQVFAHWALAMLGRLDDLGSRLPRRLREAQERGDRYATTSLRTGAPTLLRLAADDPQGARADAEDAMRQWSRSGFYVQHVTALISQSQIDLYLGDPDGARRRLEDAQPTWRRSQLWRIGLLRVLLDDVRGRAAVAAGDAAKARAIARRLAREPWAWSHALAELVRAGVDTPDAARGCLERAAATFDACGMSLHAAVARRRLGALLGGDEGRALSDDADAWMYGERVDRPARMTALLAPGAYAEDE